MLNHHHHHLGEKAADQQQQNPETTSNCRKVSQTPSVQFGNAKRSFTMTDKDRQVSLSGEETLIHMGPVSIYRPRQLKVVAAFSKEDSLLSCIQNVVHKLKWRFSWIKCCGNNCSNCITASNPPTSSSSPHPGTSAESPNPGSMSWKPLMDELTHFTPLSPLDILVLDYRQIKTLPTQSLDIIRTLKSERAILTVVAFVRKCFFDKADMISLLLEAGIDRVEVDQGITSSVYWIYEFTQLEKVVDSAYKLGSTEALITALDHCRDLIQITDSHNRIQFVNRAYEKLLGFSSEELLGLDFLEIQNRIEQSWAATRQSPVPSTSDNNPNRSNVVAGSGGTNPPTNLQDSTSPTTALAPLQTPATSALSAPPPSKAHQTFHDHILDELTSGRQWEGNYIFNKKTGEPLFLNSRLFPFSTLHDFARRASRTDQEPPAPTSEQDKTKRVVADGGGTTHYIYLSEVPSAYREKSLSSDLTTTEAAGGGGYNPMPRGSLKSLRKASYDIKSISNDSRPSSPSTQIGPPPNDPPPELFPSELPNFGADDEGSILRRQSLAKLHSLTIEAPITKVINIITAAQQSCPIYIAHSLDKVLEILRTTELYSPQFFEGNRPRTDDPLTTDLLGALLSQGPKSLQTVRRSSNENTASRLAPRPSLPDIAEAPGRLQRLLETEARWDFDVILLEEITEKRPLVWTGMAIFSRFGAAQTLGTDETTLRNWLTLIEANYHSPNAYHNSTHAADVLQATAYFMSTERLKTFLEPLDEVISLIAAIVHDVDHPGKTSHYLTNTGNELSLLYNDLSILESHHAAFAFKLTLSDPRVNIFKNLDTDTYKAVRKSIIDMVLATEMTKHFEHLSKFINVFTKPLQKKDELMLSESTQTATILHQTSLSTDVNPSPVVTPTEPDISTLVTPDNIILIKRMLIKCADVANPTRPLKLCIAWANRIAEEYFRQTEEEIARGLPPVMPMFERETCSIPKSQTGFVDYFVADMFDAWDTFLDLPEVSEHLNFNYSFWKDLESQGIHSAGQVNAYLRQLNGEGSSTSSSI